MRVAVAVGKDFDNEEEVHANLDQHHHKDPITAILHPRSKAGDIFAAWARHHGIPTEEFAPNWGEGDGAHKLRNQRMIEIGQPDLLVEFPGGKDAADLRRRAKKAGVPVVKTFGKGVTDDTDTG